MKHKILISVDHGFNRSELLTTINSLLNTTHSKFLTGISLSNYLEKKLVLASPKPSKELKPPSAPKSFENPKGAKSPGVNFEMFKGEIDDTVLGSLSSVADLLIIDSNIIEQFGGEDILADLVAAVTCPVLVLPDDKPVNSLIMVHDGTLSSVKAVKYFISLFDQQLRNLPVSVLVSDPKDKKDIESEKVFIDYIKLFFGDIGIQLMDNEPVQCLIKNIERSSQNPMIILGRIVGNDVLGRASEHKSIISNAPTFIYKNT